MGLLMTVIFSAAAAFLGLKVGQVFEAAIPIAIIAVGVSSALGKKNALGQNVMIQSIGSCSGAIVAGAIFTLRGSLHPAGQIPGADGQLHQGILLFAARRGARNTLPHTFQKIFRERDAREIILSPRQLPRLRCS